MKNGKKAKWSLAILEYEIKSMLRSECANTSSLTWIEMTGMPILFPSDKYDPVLGYWKVPERASLSLLVHEPDTEPNKERKTQIKPRGKYLCIKNFHTITLYSLIFV